MPGDPWKCSGGYISQSEPTRGALDALIDLEKGSEHYLPALEQLTESEARALIVQEGERRGYTLAEDER